MKHLVSLSSVLGIALALGCASGGDDAEVAAGRALFEANCLQCHGPRGLGDGPMAPSLPVKPASLIEHLAHHTRAQLVQLVQRGIPPAMPPQPLTEGEVDEVVDYLWTLVPADRVEALRSMQQQVESGAAMPAMPGMGGMSGMDHSGH